MEIIILTLVKTNKIRNFKSIKVYYFYFAKRIKNFKIKVFNPNQKSTQKI